MSSAAFLAETRVPRTVRLPEAVWQELLRHAKEAAPEECCGLLLGRGDEVARTIRAKNIAPDSRRRFLVDPADHFSALRQARAAGLTVVGAYHSHPHGDPQPSDTDRGEAMPDDQFIHVLVAPREGHIAAYSLMAGNFVPLQLVRVA